MKLVTNKQQQEISVEDCTDDKVYVMVREDTKFLLTGDGNGQFRFRPIDQLSTNRFPLAAGRFIDVVCDNAVANLVYQFDTMREAMLFVFGEKEVWDGK